MKLTKTLIEWADYTWNPVIGCRQGCWYCYAEKANKRFHFVKDFSVPEYFPEKVFDFTAPKMPKVRNSIAAQISPDKPLVFIGSMGDIFACGPKPVNDIIEVIKANPDVNFAILTKSEQYYNVFRWPLNCFLGVTLTGSEKLLPRDSIESFRLQKVDAHFISFEPLLGDCSHYDLSFADFVIVGALTGHGNQDAMKIRHNIKSIRHTNIYLKNNIIRYLD